MPPDAVARRHAWFNRARPGTVAAATLGSACLRRSAGSRRSATVSPSSRGCRVCGWMRSCDSPAASSASPRCWSAAGSAACCWTTCRRRGGRGQPSVARATSCACRWGRALLGRVVEPARPAARRQAAPIAAESQQPIERAAPAIIDRDLVVQPVQTGLVVVDTLFALGRGQRELIIGDRAIGKTTIGIDTIINQKDSDIVCVYVAGRAEELGRPPGDRRDPGLWRARPVHRRGVRGGRARRACNGSRRSRR